MSHPRANSAVNGFTLFAKDTTQLPDEYELTLIELKSRVGILILKIDGRIKLDEIQTLNQILSQAQGTNKFSITLNALNNMVHDSVQPFIKDVLSEERLLTEIMNLLSPNHIAGVLESIIQDLLNNKSIQDYDVSSLKMLNLQLQYTRITTELTSQIIDSLFKLEYKDQQEKNKLAEKLISHFAQIYVGLDKHCASISIQDKMDMSPNYTQTF